MKKLIKLFFFKFFHPWVLALPLVSESGNLWVWVIVKSWVNLLTWLLIGCKLLNSQSGASLLVDTTLDNDNMTKVSIPGGRVHVGGGRGDLLIAHLLRFPLFSLPLSKKRLDVSFWGTAFLVDIYITQSCYTPKVSLICLRIRAILTGVRRAGVEIGDPSWELNLIPDPRSKSHNFTGHNWSSNTQSTFSGFKSRWAIPVMN